MQVSSTHKVLSQQLQTGFLQQHIRCRSGAPNNSTRKTASRLQGHGRCKKVSWRQVRCREGICTCSAEDCSVRSAVCTNSGPRKEPPMPMATTSVSAFPVAPFHSPERTCTS